MHIGNVSFTSITSAHPFKILAEDSLTENH